MLVLSSFQAMIISILIAASMLMVMFLSIYLFKNGNRRYYINFSIFLALTMLGMNLAFYMYLLTSSFLFLIIISAGFMFGSILVFIKNFLGGPVFSLAFSLIITFAEISMSALIYTLTTRRPADIIMSIGSPWFIYIMLLEMIFSLAISWKKIDKMRKHFFYIFIMMMPLFPNLYPDQYVIIWVSSFLMIVGTVFVFDTLYKNRGRSGSELFFAFEIVSIYSIMMGGEFYYFLYGSWNIYFISMAIAMVWFIYRIFQAPSKHSNYLNNKWTSFLLVLVTFIMEWFMGGVLEFNNGQFGSGLGGFISSLSFGWAPPTDPLSFIFDFISIIVTVTASVWFLIMMGLEMGFLALRKMMQSKIIENKIRLGLMISAYAGYSIFIPYFSPLSPHLKYIPYMWSMGIGTNGPVTNSVLIALVGTYLISALLSFLFGSRQLCSVTCTAPLMYQGTFYDSLKKFNRTTKIGRKTLTSRIGSSVKFIILFVNIIVLASAIISYLDSNGTLNWYIYGNDPSVVMYALMFNLVWYLGFVMSPLMGTYACVNQGWCYWGTFNQAVGRLGFFRLKVKDANACLKCKTVDCATACPVGITDMRKAFIDKGEFKAFKCIGVGDCVEACPYDNIFFYDVRHVIRDKILRKKS